MFQVGSFVFGVITVMATAPDVFDPKNITPYFKKELTFCAVTRH